MKKNKIFATTLIASMVLSGVIFTGCSNKQAAPETEATTTEVTTTTESTTVEETTTEATTEETLETEKPDTVIDATVDDIEDEDLKELAQKYIDDGYTLTLYRDFALENLNGSNLISPEKIVATRGNSDFMTTGDLPYEMVSLNKFSSAEDLDFYYQAVMYEIGEKPYLENPEYEDYIEVTDTDVLHRFNLEFVLMSSESDPVRMVIDYSVLKDKNIVINYSGFLEQ